MSRLVVNGQEIPLKPGTSLSFDLNNLLFEIFESEPAGSFTYGFNIPKTPEAQLAFGFPELMVNAALIPKSFPDAEYFDGPLYVVGTLKYLGMAGDEYRFNLETGLSRVLRKLRETKLTKLALGGQRYMGGDTDAVLQHMLATVNDPAAHDYVFAPVHNPDFYGDENDDYQEYAGQYLNYWENTFDGAGNATGGYFLKNAQFHTNGPEGSTRHSICPHPYLKYVLLEAFKELSIPVEDHFFDSELSTLVILGVSALDNIKAITLGANEVVFEHNVYKNSFFLADVLPDISLWDLLKANLSTWGMFPDISLDGKVRLRKVSDILQSEEYDELSEVEQGFESENDAETGKTLTYNLDSDDSLAGERVKDFKDVTVREEVPDLATLNSPGIKEASQVKDVRYVAELDHHYIYSRFRKNRYSDAEYFWEFYSENYVSEPLEGGGAELQLGVYTTLMQLRYRANIKVKPSVTHLDALYILLDQQEQDGIENLVEENDVRLVDSHDKYFIYAKTFTESDYEKSMDWQPFCDNTPAATKIAFRKWLVPALGVPGYSPEYDQDERPQGLRLLFYRGLQNYDQTNATYPMLSTEANSAQGIKVGNYSMRWNGPEGLKEIFWKKYLEIKLKGKPARRKIYLDSSELQNMDLLRKKKIDGVLYKVVRVRFSSPVSKAATVDLVTF